jgi:GT2 family glycosyltransferase
VSFDATATIVVTTKDRVDDLRKCLHSARQQGPVAEIIVIDDASTDATAAMVRREFPEVTLVVHDRPQGYIRGRNEAARLATGTVIVSLDDDAAFSSAAIVGRALEGFSDDRIAAVAIPYIDINRDSVVRQCAPEPEGVYVTASFIGTAHAIRKDRFLQVGGYREELFHQGEESDLCLRLLSAGYVVRLGTGEPIHHFESPKRDFRRMDHYGPRNAILFAWQNTPFPLVIANLLATTARVLTWTLSPSRLATRAAGALSGFGACLRQERRPVSAGVFLLWRRLRGAVSPLPLAEVAGSLERLGL